MATGHSWVCHGGLRKGVAMVGKGVRLFTLFGFTVRVDASWLVIAVLVAWSLATTRSSFGHRAVVLGADRNELTAGLAAVAAGETGAVTGEVRPGGVRIGADCAAALGVKVGDVVRFAPLRPTVAKYGVVTSPAARSVA